MTDPDIADFLLARIAEDKAAAQAAKTPVDVLADISMIYKSGGRWLVGWNGDSSAAAAVIALRNAVTDPARVLAECEAKRRIVEAYKAGSRGPLGFGDDDAFPAVGWAIYQLAQPYNSHPDYQQQWEQEFDL